MPYKSEKIKLPKELDRRIKISDEIRESVKTLYYQDGYSMRKIGRELKIDRTSVRNILFPEKYQEQLKRHKKEKHWQRYYDKDKHAQSIREYRRYKQKLFLSGQIKELIQNDIV